MKINQCKTEEEVLTYLQEKYGNLLKVHSKSILNFPTIALTEFHKQARELEQKANEQMKKLQKKQESK